MRHRLATYAGASERRRRAGPSPRRWTPGTDGAPRSPTTSAPPTWHDDLDDSELGAVDVPGHWRRHPAFADARRAAALPRAASRPTAPPTASAPGWRSTASSTRATSGSTAPTSATPRATSSAHLRGHRRAARDRAEHLLAVEVTCCTARRPHGQAQPHRRLPALGLPRPRLEPGRHLAPGAASSETGPVRIRRLAVRLPRGRPASRGHARASGPSLDSDAARHRHVPHRRSDGVADDVHRPARWPPATTSSSGPLDRRPTRSCGGRGPSATSDRYRRARSRPSPRTAAVSHDRRARAPACARSRCDDWICRSTASGCSSRAPTSARPGRRWPRRHRRDVRRATSSWPARPASTCCGSTPTSPAPSSTTRPTRRGCSLWQDLPLQWGYARARPQAGGAPGRKAAVDLLGHHPSIAIWCGHNEPLAIDATPADGATRRPRRRVGAEGAAARSCRPGTRPCSTARSSGRSRRPTAPAR